MKNRIGDIYALERLAGGTSCVHRLHPSVKVLATAIFIITVVSFDRYSFGRMVPYVFYPTLLASLAETPYSLLLKRFLITLPFCLLAGMANVLFDRDIAFIIGTVTVSYGVVSLFTILFRVYLCVMAILALISATPFAHIINAMRRLQMPHILLMVLEMTYRYIGVLFEEAYSMNTAYSLRSSNVKGIGIRDMGSFAGHLLIRSFDRADRVYNAMKCRGYALNSLSRGRKLAAGDVIFLALICFFCTAFRLLNVNALFAGMIGRFG